MLVNVALLRKVKESRICRQIGFERSLLVGKLRLYTSLTIFTYFVPGLAHERLRLFGVSV